MLQQEFKKKILDRARRVVIKIGSQVLSTPKGVAEERIRPLVRDLAVLRDNGKELILVSSGAIAAGLAKLGIKERPVSIPQKQALAAVGQIKLMALYEREFSRFEINIAQVLLTHEDLATRRRYLNAKHTLQTLLDSKLIPIVNENDTVAVEEIKFGDNDHLSSLVATLLGADLLIILSDVDGIYDRDPRHHGSAQLFSLISKLKGLKGKISGESRSPYGTGGISTKISAVEKATTAGIPTIIANGLDSRILSKIFNPEEEVGTLILPEKSRLASRKHWIAYNMTPSGTIVVDRGAYDALVKKGKSLLPSGLKEVRGSFAVGECVRCLSPHGKEFARGLVNYSARELNQIKGLHSTRIEKILGHKVVDEIIHRDDLVLL